MVDGKENHRDRGRARSGHRARSVDSREEPEGYEHHRRPYKIDKSVGQRLIIEWLFSRRRKAMLESLCGDRRFGFLRDLRRFYGGQILDSAMTTEQNKRSVGEYIETAEPSDCRDMIHRLPTEWFRDRHIYERLEGWGQPFGRWRGRGFHRSFRIAGTEIKEKLLGPEDILFKLYFYCDDVDIKYALGLQPRASLVGTAQKLDEYTALLDGMYVTVLSALDTFAEKDDPHEKIKTQVKALKRRVSNMKAATEKAATAIKEMIQYKREVIEVRDDDRRHLEKNINKAQLTNLEATAQDWQRARNARDFDTMEAAEHYYQKGEKWKGAKLAGRVALDAVADMPLHDAHMQTNVGPPPVYMRGMGYGYGPMR